MKKIATILLSATLLSSSSFAANAKDNVLATFNNTKVTEAEVSKKLASFLKQSGKEFSGLEKDMQKALVEGYIGIMLFEQEAIKLGINRCNNQENE